jgi:hypothetical protein
MGNAFHSYVSTSICSTYGEKPELKPPPNSTTLFFSGQKQAQFERGNLSLTLSSSHDASVMLNLSIASNLFYPSYPPNV